MSSGVSNSTPTWYMPGRREDFRNEATRAFIFRPGIPRALLVEPTSSVTFVFLRKRKREKYLHPWQLMETVAVSSRRAFPPDSAQVTTSGTSCKMRVLRRLGPLASTAGGCSLTRSMLRAESRIFGSQSEYQTRNGPLHGLITVPGHLGTNQHLGAAVQDVPGKYKGNSGRQKGPD
jgi:hypothetical protein